MSLKRRTFALTCVHVCLLSDSGDSIFFTQKPLPEAVRSGGRRLARFRSTCTQEGPAEPEDDILSSSSSSEEESRTKRKKRRRKVFKVPSYRFSFLSERNGQANNSLLRVKMKQLHVRLHKPKTSLFFT